MADPIETQDSNLLPPRRGNIYPITVDSTARSYDLASLVPGYNKGDTRTVFLTLGPVGGNVFYHFRDDAGAPDLSDSSVIAASGGTAIPNTLTPTAAYACVIPDGARVDHRISVPKDRYLVLKTASGTSILYLFTSSNEAGPA